MTTISQHEIERAAKDMIVQQDRARHDAVRQEVTDRLQREQAARVLWLNGKSD